MSSLRAAVSVIGTAVAALVVAAPQAAHAQSGSWAVTTGGDWSNTANWTGGTIADGQDSTATFNQTLSGEVTVDLDSPRTLGNLSFTSGSNQLWRIDDAGNPANVLTLSRSDATAPTITVATSTRAEIATVIDGTGGLGKTGASNTGILILSGANTYSGTTTVTGGILRVANNDALGTSSVSVSGTSGVHLADGITVTGRSITVGSNGLNSDGGLAMGATGVGVWAGTVTTSGGGRIGVSTLANGGTLEISGKVTGDSLNISAYDGKVVLSAAAGTNDYATNTNILRGMLALGAANTLPTTTILDVHSGTATGFSQEAILDLNGFSQEVAQLKNTGNLYGQATVTNSSATAGTLTVNQAANTTYSGRITGAMSLVKSGAGNLTLAPTLIVNPGSSATRENTANTFTGTTRVDAGTLTLSAHSGTDSQALSASTYDTASAGTLSFGTMTSATFGGLSGTGTLTLANASSGAVTLSLGGGNSSGSFGGTLTGAGGLTKVGTGTLTLSGTNDYAGNTAVSAGTLAISSTTTIPGLTTAGRFSVAAGATLATPSSFSDADLEAIVATGNFVANGILGIDTSGGNRVFANPLTGTVGLTVGGGNSVTLSGANALGPIALTGSTLIIENTAALAVGTGGTGSITIDGGAITANLGPSSYSFNGRSIVVAGAGGTFRNDGGNLLTFGNISGSAPVVFESGTGTIVTNSNTYSGGTTIKPGARIAYTSGTGFGSGPVTIQGGSLRSSQGTPQTVGNDVTLAGNVTFNASGTNVDNNLVFTGPMTLSGGDHTIDVSMSPRPGATGIFFNGVIGDGVNTHGFTKAGPGTLVLAGANTYGGATTVSAGTLLVNGDQSAAAGAVSVASGATLGGSGTLGGATTISGIHSPGNSPGVQTFASDLSYTGGSASVVWELTGNTSTQGSPTAVYDQILVGGNLDFAAVTSLSLVFNSSGSTVDWSNEFWGSDKTWTLYDVAGTTSNLGNFTIQPDTWLDSTNAALATIRPNAAFSLTPSGEDVLLSYVAVPEPESMAAVAAGLAALAAAFRRRRTAQTA